MYDVLLKGGEVVDPSQGLHTAGSLAIQDEKIALIEGVSDMDQLTRELQALISGGPLYGYRVEPVKRTITIFDPRRPPGPPKPRTVSFTCEACGAKNRFETIDDNVRCEFCGTPWVGGF